MDILLGDDANGFDLMVHDNHDLLLTANPQERLWNAIKIAIFTQESWAGSRLLAYPLGSSIERLVRLPVTQENQKVIARELARVLQFVIEENMANSLSSEVIIVDKKRYSLRITIDGRLFTLDNILEVRE